jgi:hypothetical protein
MKVGIEMWTRGLEYERFRQVYFSEGFSRELVRAADLSERSVRVREVLPDGRERIRLHIAPRVHLPGWVAKIALGQSLSYDEDTLVDHAARRAHTIVHTPGRDLLRVTADSTFCEEPGGLRTRIELDLHARLLGLGSAIERFAARETEARYRVVERTLQQYVDAGSDRP